jgi:hypothetical protein
MHASMALVLGLLLPFSSEPYFLIQVVDAETGRPVPLVELRTVNNIVEYTDSNGIVAFNEPGLMNQQVFFFVRSHGYEYPKDGFGFQGASLITKPGLTAVLKIHRRQIAQRLYRVTGQGIYHHSLRAQLPTPLREPALNAQVLGQDSVVNAVFQGKIYWFWGDTLRPSYPLGNFHVPGATSLLPGQGGLDPEIGVDLEYFLDDDGFAKATCAMPGPGPTWISGLTVLRDAQGQEQMFAAYGKIKVGTLEAYQRGLVQFDEERREFRKVKELPVASRLRPEGRPLYVQVDGKPYVYFATPFPILRVPASVDALLDPSQYEAFTPLREGTAEPSASLERRPDGTLRYAWKKNTAPVTYQELRDLAGRGHLRPAENLFQLIDRDTGQPVLAHAGSVYWNAFRKRWIMITSQFFGSSVLGEVWYSEADTPIGPWGYAVKIVTHEKYSFYNPKQHPMFDKEGGRVIFFEGTYSTMFSDAPFPTPRYDYNQIMYKLDLSDPRVVLPVPVYDLSPERTGERFQTGLPADQKDAFERIVFWAPDRPLLGTVALVARNPKQLGGQLLPVEKPEALHQQHVVFYALTEPLPGESPSQALYEYRHRDGNRFRYSIRPDEKWSNYERQPKPIGYVWKNPLDTSLLREAETQVRPWRP